jgi:molybdate transport system substrate-binding protein
MRFFASRLVAGLATITLMGGVTSAIAAEIKVLSTIAMQSVFEELTPQFEQASGHKLNVTFGLSAVMAKRVQDGETADLVASTRGGIDGLIKSGKVVPGSDNTLVRSSIGVAVRKGAPRPEISTPDGLKRALLAAKSISYSDPAAGGSSGVHFAKVLERLGIAGEMKAKTKFPPAGGFTVQLLLRGEVDLAIQQISELTVEGIEVVGPLPGDLQSITVYAAAIPVSAREPNAAKALIDFLRSPDAIAAVRAKGLDPN